jgi:hypothetical protein
MRPRNQMTLTVRVEVDEVRSRLAELGLEETSIAEVVRRGYGVFISCTANDPPLFPGFAAWAQMVRALREYLLPQNWERSNENNYSLVINPEGTMAIAVATGDDATGRVGVTPTTKSSKGPSTVEAVTSNQFQLSLDFPPVSISSPEQLADDDKRMTWILLVHRAVSEVRCELSLPRSMGNDGHIDSWQERIILGSIPVDTELLEITPSQPSQPDINIDIKRRA